MTILALDIATETGYTIIEDSLILHSGSIVYKKESKYEAFNNSLTWFFSNFIIDAVVTEMPSGRFARSIITQSELLGILKLKANYFKTPVIELSVTGIKKWATGSGLASKDQMVEASRKFGYNGKNHNEADAILMGFYYLNNLNTV